MTTVVLNLTTIEASNNFLAATFTRCSIVRMVIKRLSAIRRVGQQARPPNPVVESQSAMVQVDLLVPPKHQETRQLFVTRVAEQSKPQPRMVSVQRSALQTAVVWALRVNLAITGLFETLAGARLVPLPTMDHERPFGTAQGVHRDQPAADDEAIFWASFIRFHFSR